MMHPEIWLVRHGETEWSRTGRHTGRTDVPLTAAGIEQVTRVTERISGRRFALVLSSPLRRASDTCRLAGLGDVARATEDLMEWDYGAYEGRTRVEIQKDVPGWTIWNGGVPGGETIEQVAVRARRVIEEALGAGGGVALFGHGHVLRILAACWLELPPRDGRLFPLDTASVGVLGYDGTDHVLRAWNV